MRKAFESFDEFWEEYVRDHAKQSVRRWHFVATSLGLTCVAGAIVGRRPWLLLAAPAVTLTPAVLSHVLVERSLPKSLFRHPLWSLRADLRMWSKTLDGSMEAEVDRVFAVEPVAREEPTVNMRTDGTLH